MNGSQSNYLRKCDSSSEFRIENVIADHARTILHVTNIYSNKKMLQYHLNLEAMTKHFQVKVKRSTRSLLHVVCNDDRCQWQVRATKLNDSDMFVIRRYEELHTCSIEIRQGQHCQAKSWMIGECVKAKYVDPMNTTYRPWDIIRDIRQEYGVSFNYIRAWRAKEAALSSLRGDDAESYQRMFFYLVNLN